MVPVFLGIIVFKNASLETLKLLQVCFINLFCSLVCGLIEGSIMNKILKVPDGYRYLVLQWLACNNIFGMPFVLLTGMCKPFGYLRNYDCGFTFVLLGLHTIVNSILGFSVGRYLVKKEAR